MKECAPRTPRMAAPWRNPGEACPRETQYPAIFGILLSSGGVGSDEIAREGLRPTLARSGGAAVEPREPKNTGYASPPLEPPPF